MINTILGSKQTISQTFVNGLRIPVTKVVAGPCVVTQIKKMDKDGYWAVQLGIGTKTAKNTSKSLQGHLKESTKSTNYPKFLREIRLEKEPELKVGDQITVSDIFSVGDKIAVSGTSKGKGYAGVVKRHHFRGGPKTHGQSDRERAPGSIGQTTTPGRVYKGKRMAGRMGGEFITVKNIHVISIDKDKNEMMVSGPIPGKTNALLVVNKLSSGSLAELEHETPSTIVEGGAAKTAVSGAPAPAAAPAEAPAA